MAHSRALLLLSALSAVYSYPSPIVARAAAPPSSTNCASPNSTYDPTVSTLFSRADNGSLTEFGRTDAGATIHALCVRNSTGLVYIAGDFGSFGGVQTPSVASLDPTTGTFSSLSGGVDGPVYALSCAEDKLWAGGQFSGPNGTDLTGFGGNVATWDYASASWSSPPFVGLDGPVWAIDPVSSSSGSSVFLGGEFSVSFAQPLYNATGVADVPSLGSALATISLQNGNTSVQTSPSSSATGFGDPSNMFCPPGADGPGSTWLAAEGQANATITVEVGRAVTAAGIRLGNTFVNGSGTNTFQLVAMPNNVVIPLTYLDPTTNTILNCTGACPLAQNPALPYQDFIFPKGTFFSIFQLQLLTFYGAGSGLHLLQLLSDGSAAYAVEFYNDGGATCFSGLGAVGGISRSLANGDLWRQASVAAEFPGTAEEVLVATVPRGTNAAQSPTVVFDVFVPVSAAYDVHFYTPGCWRTDDCATRGKVDVQIQPLGNGAGVTTATVDQTNQNDLSAVVATNVDLLASSDPGNATSGGGLRVTVSMSAGAADGADVDLVVDKVLLYASGNTTGTIVKGDQARAMWEYVVSSDGAVGGGQGAGTDPLGVLSGGGANGSAGASIYDRLGAGMSGDAIVTSLAFAQDVGVVYVGGQFAWTAPSGTTSPALRNILAAGPTGQAATVPNGGLDGIVSSLAVGDGYLFAGGSFDATQDGSVTGMQGLARWRYAGGSSWEAIGAGAGLGGNVTGLTVSGTSLLVTGAGGKGLAAYDLGSSSWSSSAVQGAFDGNLTAVSTAGDPSGLVFLAGNVASADAALAGHSLSCQPSTPTPTPSPPSTGPKGTHSVGIVILISMAIALGIVFFGVIVCLFVALCLRRRRGGDGQDAWLAAAASSSPSEKKRADHDGDSVDLRHRPTSLLATLNAATAAMAEKQLLAARERQRSPAAARTAEGTREGPDEEDGEEDEQGMVTAEDGEPDMRRARWSFQEERDGEISVKAGEVVEVLDRSDSEWWLVRTSAGRQGAIPADWFL